MTNLDLFVQTSLLTGAFWLVTYLLHSTLLIAITWVLTRWIIRYDELREVLWKSACFGGVISALIQTALSTPIRNAWQMISAHEGVQVFHQIQTEELFAPVFMTVEPIMTALPADTVLVTAVWSAPFAAIPLAGWVAALLAIWSGGAGWMIVRLFLAYRSLEAELQTRTQITDGPLFELLQQLQGAAQYQPQVRLSCTPMLSSPVALPGNEICIPLRVLTELDYRQQQALLAHELAHVIRRDPYWYIVMQVLEAILFLQPLNRFVCRQIQSSIEILCDDCAIRWTGQPRALANCLVTVATWIVSQRPEPALTALATHGRSFLQRVHRLLEPQTAVTPAGRRLSAGLILVMLFCLSLSVPSVPEAWFTETLPEGATVVFSAAPIDVRMPLTDTTISIEDSQQQMLILRQSNTDPYR